MQHAEAHERLSDLALEPGRLARLESDPTPEAAELRAHLVSCERCTADLAGWRRTWAEAGPALRGDERLDAIHAPASLRSRILAAAAAAPNTVPAGAAGVAGAAEGVGAADPTPISLIRRLSTSRSVPWLLAAAAVVVAVVGSAFGLARTSEVIDLRAQAAELEAVSATFDRVLAAPKHWTVTLATADGAAGGTLAWSPTEIVVVTTGLPAPGDGQVYRCWVELNGTRTPMGSMAFATATAYWAGPMESWGGPWKPGTRFGVSLVPKSGAATPVLIGTY